LTWLSRAVATGCSRRGPRTGNRRASALAWRGSVGSGFAAGSGGASFGVGAALALGALTISFARAVARRGIFGGDPTVATIVVVIAALLLLFIFYPVGTSLFSAVLDTKGHFAPGLAANRLLTADIWSVDCLRGGVRCGVAINSAMLGVTVGVLSTLLGLCWRWWCSAAVSVFRACSR
jgi:iron(III) transport system permease protein